MAPDPIIKSSSGDYTLLDSNGTIRLSSELRGATEISVTGSNFWDINPAWNAAIGMVEFDLQGLKVTPKLQFTLALGDVGVKHYDNPGDIERKAATDNNISVMGYRGDGIYTISDRTIGAETISTISTGAGRSGTEPVYFINVTGFVKKTINPSNNVVGFRFEPLSESVFESFGKDARLIISPDFFGGGDYSENIYGDRKNNSINGEGGDDKLVGGAGNDTLNGGEGDDSLYGNDGKDTLNGGEGNDFIDGGNEDDRIDGDNGDDVVDAGNGNDRISGGEGNDFISGGQNNDDIRGGKGNDELAGEEGNDIIMGGDGDDIIDGGKGNDVINGGSGKNLLRGASTGAEGGRGEIDTLIGSSGNDTFILGENGNIYYNDGRQDNGVDEVPANRFSSSIESIKSRPGWRSTPPGGSRFHYGVDYSSDAVRRTYTAGVSGVVKRAGGGDFNTITVKVGQGKQTKLIQYLHSSRIDVVVGQTVTPDTILGKTGGKGPNGLNHYTVHLHIQAKDRYGRDIDPNAALQGEDNILVKDWCQGRADYAIIKNFKMGQDIIQLEGRRGDYNLLNLPEDKPVGSIPGGSTVILLDDDGTNKLEKDELVGAIIGKKVTSFNTGFSFV